MDPLGGEGLEVSGGATRSAKRGRSASREAGCVASVHTEAVTPRRGSAEDRHKFTSAEPAEGKTYRQARSEWLQRLYAGRSGWLQRLDLATGLYRSRKAARLDARARELGAEKRKAWRLSGAVARSSSGGIQRGGSGGSALGGPAAAGGESLKAYRTDPWLSRWHAARAEGARGLFRSVAVCGDKDKGHFVKLTCRGCSAPSTIQIGCGSTWFCPGCRKRRSTAFALDLQRKILGVTTAAARAGLTQRWRRHQDGGRFGARLISLTLPHVGGVAERIEVLQRVWARFWRLLSDHLRPKLAGKLSGIWIDDKPKGETFNGEQREATLWDLVQYLKVQEWTPGSDGKGHPHLHVWLFSPYIDRDEVIEPLWRRAYEDVTSRKVERLVVDVRAAYGEANDVAAELTKYLVKDWEIDHGGSKQVADEVFAQAYAALDGKRLRQTSSGLAQFAVAVVKACPDCGHCSERGHWAHVQIGHTIRKAVERGFVPSGVPPPSEEHELETYEWMMLRASERQHAAWLESPEGVRVVAALRRDLMAG